ncbi:hypothetical protein M8C21_029302 [Ambrosia artemisiifolia]|uniref:Uncharacterized protein n=1 Tax=Ambrosia artemisiifolia TaxID=4212 RepID=A0AAD5D727_AMBAR|nr:hypothetical protein M8C21_029302 [Ambrosia artemisiifolia]
MLGSQAKGPSSGLNSSSDESHVMMICYLLCTRGQQWRESRDDDRKRREIRRKLVMENEGSGDILTSDRLISTVLQLSTPATETLMVYKGNASSGRGLVRADQCSCVEVMQGMELRCKAL